MNQLESLAFCIRIIGVSQVLNVLSNLASVCKDIEQLPPRWQNVSVNAFRTITTTIFSLFRAMVIASSKCFATLEKRVSYSLTILCRINSKKRTHSLSAGYLESSECLPDFKTHDPLNCQNHPVIRLPAFLEKPNLFRLGPHYRKFRQSYPEGVLEAPPTICYQL